MSEQLIEIALILLVVFVAILVIMMGAMYWKLIKSEEDEESGSGAIANETNKLAETRQKLEGALQNIDKLYQDELLKRSKISSQEGRSEEDFQKKIIEEIESIKKDLEDLKKSAKN